MQRLIIELPEDELKKLTLVQQCLNANMSFRVESDPMVAVSPLTIEASLTEARTAFKPKRHIQKRTADGRTSDQVVADKVASFGERKFSLSQIDAMAPQVGFDYTTLRQKLQRMVKAGQVEKIGRYHYRAIRLVVVTGQTPGPFGEGRPQPEASSSPQARATRPIGERVDA